MGRSVDLTDMIKNSLGLTFLLFTALSAAQGVSDDLVPVLMIAPSPVVTPLRPDPKAPLILGMVSRADIMDGLPYRVGFYEVEQGVALGGLTGSFSGFQLRAKPVCNMTPLGDSRDCHRVEALLSPPAPDGKGAAAKLGYQFGPVDLSAAVSLSKGSGLAASLNPALPWPGQNLSITWLDQLDQRESERRQLGIATGVESQWGSFTFGASQTKHLMFESRSAIEQSRLSMQWLYGSIGAFVGANRFDFGGAAAVQTGFDLGLTWQTPWQGIFQIGARQILTTGKTPKMLDPKQAPGVLDDVEPMPYVHYEQDL